MGGRLEQTKGDGRYSILVIRLDRLGEGVSHQILINFKELVMVGTRAKGILAC